jgi:hypothetical protein
MICGSPPPVFEPEVPPTAVIVPPVPPLPPEVLPPNPLLFWPAETGHDSGTVHSIFWPCHMTSQVVAEDVPSDNWSVSVTLTGAPPSNAYPKFRV